MSGRWRRGSLAGRGDVRQQGVLRAAQLRRNPRPRHGPLQEREPRGDQQALLAHWHLLRLAELLRHPDLGPTRRLRRQRGDRRRGRWLARGEVDRRGRNNPKSGLASLLFLLPDLACKQNILNN